MIAWRLFSLHSENSLMGENRMEALANTVRHLPGIDDIVVEDPDEASGWDGSLDLVSRKKRVRLLVECKRRLFPRDVGELLSKRQIGVDDFPVMVAESISPGARVLLQKQGVNYWDSSGSIFLNLPWAVYLVDRPAPRESSRRTKNLYRGSSAVVVHRMLLEHKRGWKVQELAHESDVSLATVHQVFTTLEELGMLSRSGKGPQTVRHLEEPGQLLDSWASQHSLRDYTWKRFYRLSRSPEELEQAVADVLRSSPSVIYGLTLEAGAARVAPWVTTLERWSVILENSTDGLEDQLKRQGFRAVDEGENLLLLICSEPSPLQCLQEVGGLWVASPVQLYLDLKASPRRGKEQALHLRNERLGY